MFEDDKNLDLYNTCRYIEKRAKRLARLSHKLVEAWDKIDEYIRDLSLPDKFLVRHVIENDWELILTDHGFFIVEVATGFFNEDLTNEIYGSGKLSSLIHPYLEDVSPEMAIKVVYATPGCLRRALQKLKQSERHLERATEDMASIKTTLTPKEEEP